MSRNHDPIPPKLSRNGALVDFAFIGSICYLHILDAVIMCHVSQRCRCGAIIIVIEPDLIWPTTNSGIHALSVVQQQATYLSALFQTALQIDPRGICLNR